MRGHFRHLHLKTFPMVLWGPNLVHVCLFNQGFEHSGLSHKCNSQSGNALRSHWASSFALFPICKNVFHTWTHFLDFMDPYTLHLVASPMLGLQQFAITICGECVTKTFNLAFLSSHPIPFNETFFHTMFCLT
jgi:hypothetical protein